MLYVVGGNDTTPVKKITNAGGRTTLAQDPSNYYSGKNLNPQPTSTPTKSVASTGGTTAAPVVNTTPVSTGGGGGGYSDGGSSGGGFDWNAYFAELAAERQRRADEAYERNMQRIASAYNSAASNLKSNYDSTADRLGVYRDESMADVNKDAEASLRQAYINNMLTKKNLNQRLSAMGYNGGSAESTMAKLENNYGNSRTDINETLNNNISKLDQSYGDNLANALQSYNSSMSNLDMQRMQLEMEAEAQRQAAMESFYSSVGSLAMDPSYLTALQSALTNMSSYEYDPTRATNAFVPGNAQQAVSASEGSNYAKLLAQARLDLANGTSASKLKNNLFNSVSNGELSIDTLYSILRQLGVA